VSGLLETPAAVLHQKPRYPLNVRLAIPKAGLGVLEKSLLPPAVIRAPSPPSLQPSHYADYTGTTPTRYSNTSQLHFIKLIYLCVCIYIHTYIHTRLVYAVWVSAVAFPVSPPISYHMKFAQHGFTEEADFGERIPRVEWGSPIIHGPILRCILYA
jgi:hypothetical protein